MFLVVVGASASDGLSALVGQTAEAAAPSSIFAFGVGFAAVATLLEAPRGNRWIAAGFAGARFAEAVIAAVFPALAVPLRSLSVAQTAIAGALGVMEMLREGARRG